MKLFEHSTTLSFPLEKVFAHSIDLENAPKWHAMFTSVKQITPGSIGIGSKWDVRFPGSKFTLEIIEYDAPHRVVFKGSRVWKMVPNFSIEMKSTPRGTNVRYSMHPDVPGWMRPMVRVFAPPFGRWDLNRYFRELEMQLSENHPVIATA